MTTAITRRTFLKWSAAVPAVAALPAVVAPIEPIVASAPETAPGATFPFARLLREDPGRPGVWQNVGALQSLECTHEPEAIDQTCIYDDHRHWAPTFPDPGAIHMELCPGDDETSPELVFDDLAASAPRRFRVVLPDQLNTTLDFEAFVQSTSLSADVDGPGGMEVDLSIVGDVAWTA